MRQVPWVSQRRKHNQLCYNTAFSTRHRRAALGSSETAELFLWGLPPCPLSPPKSNKVCDWKPFCTKVWNWTFHSSSKTFLILCILSIQVYNYTRNDLIEVNLALAGLTTRMLYAFPLHKFYLDKQPQNQKECHSSLSYTLIFWSLRREIILSLWEMNGWRGTHVVLSFSPCLG